MSLKRLLWSDPCFAVLCALASAGFIALMPDYYPMVQPDSSGYVGFAPSRTALYPLFIQFWQSVGFSLEGVLIVQAAFFCASLIPLVMSLLRFDVPRSLVFAFIVALGLNIGFSSLHKTILTESIYMSVSALMLAFWLDYFRTGRTLQVALVALCGGILYGIRPAAITLVPMVFISLILMWRRRDTGAGVLVGVVVLALATGPIAESVAFHARHQQRATIVPYMMMGKAAMLTRADTEYRGPHANALKPLGRQLYAQFAPAHRFLADLPSVVAWPIISSNYEAIGQFSVLNDELEKAAAMQGVPADALRKELGRQAIENNLWGFVSLTVLNYFGQWSVTALTFPPASRALNDYVSRSAPPLAELMSNEALHPPARSSRYLIYPAFLVAGIISLLLSPVLLLFIVRPQLLDSRRMRDLMVASFFAVMCQVHTVIIAAINVPTPRFLMAAYPQIVLMTMFLVLAFLRSDREIGKDSFQN